MRASYLGNEDDSEGLKSGSVIQATALCPVQQQQYYVSIIPEQ